MRILSIETSCDETAVALVEADGGLKNPHFKIFKNLMASQIKIHRPYGGIVPNLAKREHTKNLPILFRQIFGNSKSEILNSKQIPNSKSKILNAIDLIAVTVGPGLEPCLWTGINFAKELYSKLKTHNSKLKLVGVSHLEGHLYSFLLSQKTVNPKSQILNPKQKFLEFRIKPSGDLPLATTNLEFPAISLLVSGGHTILLLMKDLVHYKKLGETRDDAVGECFDKVGRLLGLAYPGGPEIEKLAKFGNSNAINFPRPMINQKNYDFSFSGLKTAVLYYLRDQKLKTHNSKFRANVAASFQAAAFDVLIYKTLRAAKEFKTRSILVSGGVASNNSLRNYLKLRIKNLELRINLLIPPKKFCLDNAVMIAVSGYVNYLRSKPRKLNSVELRGKKHRLIAQGNLGL